MTELQFVDRWGAFWEKDGVFFPALLSLAVSNDGWLSLHPLPACRRGMALAEGQAGLGILPAPQVCLATDWQLQ